MAGESLRIDCKNERCVTTDFKVISLQSVFECEWKCDLIRGQTCPGEESTNYSVLLSYYEVLLKNPKGRWQVQLQVHGSAYKPRKE